MTTSLLKMVDFYNALLDVKPAISSRPPVAILAGVKLTAKVGQPLMVETYDYELACRSLPAGAMDVTFTAVVPFAQLFEWVRKQPRGAGDYLDIIPEGQGQDTDGSLIVDKVTFVAAHRMALATLPLDEYPTVPSLGDKITDNRFDFDAAGEFADSVTAVARFAATPNQYAENTFQWISI